MPAREASTKCFSGLEDPDSPHSISNPLPRMEKEDTYGCRGLAPNAWVPKDIYGGVFVTSEDETRDDGPSA